MYKVEHLQNIVYISSNLVVLQTLIAGYKLELDCENTQEIKNFRSNALLTEARIILETLTPYMSFLAECEKGIVKLPPDNLKHIKHMMLDLTACYDWAIKEVKLKNHRLSLMKLEQDWNNE